MKSQFVKDFSKGGIEVDDVFAVKEKQNVREYKNGFMFSLNISDKTGEIYLNYFGAKDESAVQSLHSSFDVQDFIHVKGKTDAYQGIKISVNPESGSIEKKDAADLKDFIPMTKKNISQMISEFKEIISKVENPDIKKLFEHIFNNDDFMKKYSETAAATTLHHNFGGGLIEHVLSMIKIAIRVVEMHPELDKDLLIAGCIVHDIGKVRELENKAAIAYTTEGHLLGHISIGQQMVNDWIGGLESFPDILKQKILHMVLSHHGQKEWGSPVTPLFPEAVALHHIDNLDSKVQKVIQEKEQAGKDEKWVYYRGWPTLYLE